MTNFCEWNLSYPLEDSVLTDDTLNVRYRGTSGAGQLELAGSCRGADGSTIRSRDVIGSSIRFELSFSGRPPIRLVETYPVREVGGKVRISVKSNAADDRQTLGTFLPPCCFFLK